MRETEKERRDKKIINMMMGLLTPDERARFPNDVHSGRRALTLHEKEMLDRILKERGLE